MNFGIMTESLVAILLVITIGYCAVLNRRLRRLKADEASLKATISELITATEIAERAIAGLKVTVRESDQDLGERLRAAERFSVDIERQIEAGEEVLGRLCQIVAAARPPHEAAPDAHSVLAAAQALSARARARARGLAA